MIRKEKIKDIENFNLIFILALSCIFLPGLLLILSPKYQAEIVFGVGYIPVYIQYIGLSILITLTILQIQRKLYLYFIYLILIGICFLHFKSNLVVVEKVNTVIRDQRLILSEILKLSKSSLFENSNICFENSSPIHSKEFIYMYTKKNFNVFDSEKECLENGYKIKYIIKNEYSFSTIMSSNFEMDFILKKNNSKWDIINFEDIIPLFIKGFYGWEAGENSHGWTSGNSELKLFNARKLNEMFELQFTLNTLQKREIEIFYGRELIKKVEVIPGKSVLVDLNINLKGNENIIYFKTDNNVTVLGNGDSRKLSFSIDNLKYRLLK